MSRTSRIFRACRKGDPLFPMKSANKPVADSAQTCPVGPAGKGSECGTSPWKPPKFNLRFLFLVVTLAAIWCALQQIQYLQSMIVISVIMLTYLFGCPRTRNAVLTVVPAMYLPFAWLLAYIVPFDEYQRSFFQAWGHLPGVLSGRFFPESPSMEIVSAAVTVALFFTGVLALRFSDASGWAIAIPIAAICSWSSLMCYAFSRL